MMPTRTDPRRTLALLIAAWFVVSQFLLLGHQVHHGTAIDAQRRALSIQPQDQAATALPALQDASRRPVDDGGHAAGDPICLTLAHLLLTGPHDAPPGTLSLPLPPDRLGQQPGTPAALSRDHSPALPRGPPLLRPIG